jgi:ubiquinone/menaquinone biosynthesis C-methylase UbiE
MGQEAEEKSRAVWDAMAPGWERNRDFMWKMTGHVAEWLVTEVHAKPGDVILDLAGGPGDNGFLAAERVGPDGRVIETDFAEQMVEVAKRRAAELGLSNVETRVLDAQNMDLPDDSVDGIIARWGFMLMLDPGSALKECRRVLKEGGRLTFSVWGGPEKNPWVTVTGMTMMQLGHQPPGDPFGAGGMFSMADPGVIQSLVGGAGFSNVSIEEMPVVWEHRSFDEAWEFMSEVAGPIARAMEELTTDEVQTLRSALEANMAPFTTDEGIKLPGVTINVSAS